MIPKGFQLVRQARLSLVGLILSLYTGCDLLSNSNIAVLWTARPEMALYAELFNSSQDRYRIEIEYKADPSKSLILEPSHPDLVVGDRLYSSAIMKMMTSLTPLFNNRLLRNQFYPELLKLGLKDKDQLILPVSFNLPALMFNRDISINAIDSFVLTFEKIMEMSKSFSELKKSRYPTMGFSPNWDKEFLYTATVLLGADYRETPQGHLAWDDIKLKEALDFIRQWVDKVNGGPKLEQEFTEKYLHDPGYKLIAGGRILFYFTDIRKLFTISEEKRDGLDFRWIVEKDKTPVCEDILFAGIPKKSRHKEAARAFLLWFFKPETQKACLEAAQFKRIRTFGIAQGFSSLPIVNEREYPLYYPMLRGHIPPPEFLSFPKPLPIEWKKLKDVVLKPFLFDYVTNISSDEKLETRLKNWLLQKPAL
ncbi:MAG: extracellular solute-binding protein [Spirochaetota bacterium]